MESRARRGGDRRSKAHERAFERKASVRFGKMVGIGKTLVEQARFVIENDQPAAAAVKAGAKTLGDAYATAAAATRDQSIGNSTAAREDPELGGGSHQRPNDHRSSDQHASPAQREARLRRAGACGWSRDLHHICPAAGNPQPLIERSGATGAKRNIEAARSHR